jgi:acyl-CoA thioester hydrolase
MQKLIYTEKIYTYQIDYVGHVNNIIYIQWLENGRMRMLEEMGYPIDRIAHIDGILPVLVETCIKYKRPLFLNNTVKIEMWISKMNNASAFMEFRIFNEKDELCALAQQKGLFINRETQRPSRIPEMQKLAFERFLIPEGL